LSDLKSAKLAMSKPSKKESNYSTVVFCPKSEEALTSDSSRDEKAEEEPVPSTSKDNSLPQSDENAEEEPVPSTSKDNSLPQSEESRKAKLLAVAPKLPFDIDLYHWEDDSIKAPTMVA